MRMPTLPKAVVVMLLVNLTFFSVNAQAEIDNVGILDNVLNRYSTAASTWAATITGHASWLFWTLALISMVWTFGMMALRKADIGEFFAEFIRFTIFTGFFWWLLINGPNFATSIMNSLRTIAGNAAGTGSTLSPSGIVDIGFNIFSKVIDQSSAMSPVNSAVGIIISAVVFVILALIGVNMLLLLISGWILAYAGVFFLGFGGSRWTSDMAISYFKTALSIAAQLFTMVLLVGIGKSFIDQYYANMSIGISLKELGVMLIVAVVLLALVNKLPNLVGQLAMGGGTGTLGGGFGAGAVVGAAAMGAAAVATAGAALAAGTASIAGGAQALMAAYSKANATENAGAIAGDLMATPSSGSTDSSENSSSGSPLAAAMGGDFSGSTFETGDAFNTENSGGSNEAGSNNDSGSQPKQSNEARSSSEAKGSEQQADSAPSEVKPSNHLAAAGAATASLGRVAAGTVAILALGSWDVAKAKGGAMKDAALNRIGETTGGKIATAIRARGAASEPSASNSLLFDGNSLSPGKNTAADAAAEVAAFRDRETKTS